jgi:Rps23 Pro-64 3,4-dihydroxylase Tpa1-like proline 4-hydroxylase
MNRVELADRIVERLAEETPRMRSDWASSGVIRHVVIDDLLPTAQALRIRAAFPPGEAMSIKKSLRELKYVAAQMNSYDPLLEEAVFAFQDPRVVDLIGQITGLRAPEPDSLLYAGGVSMMARGHFLNPHIDNSHDKFRRRYRVLNLLYYCSPDWRLEKGGHLELWPDGVKGRQITIESRFNRLALMITNTTSWHSVSPVRTDGGRCCVSNYYFSTEPAEDRDYFHVTSFRGRPEQPLRDLLLRADIAVRMGIRRLFPKGIRDTGHHYERHGK